MKAQGKNKSLLGLKGNPQGSITLVGQLFHYHTASKSAELSCKSPTVAPAFPAESLRVSNSPSGTSWKCRRIHETGRMTHCQWDTCLLQQRQCRFCTEWGEDATGHRVSSTETNSVCLSHRIIIIWAVIHKPQNHI